MDPYLTIPIPTRIRRLRRATRHSRALFARLLGISQPALTSIERTRRVSRKMNRLAHILPQLRLLETAYARQLAREIAHPSGWGKEEKVYRPYNGNLHTLRMKEQYRGTNALPDDPKYIRELGGVELFRLSRRKRAQFDAQTEEF